MEVSKTRRSEEERDEHSLTMPVDISNMRSCQCRCRGGALAWRNGLVDAVITTMQRTVRSEKSESMQQWACCVLYNLRHQSLALKERIAKAGGMARVLDAVRIHRDSVKVNKMAAVLLCEILFEPIPDVQSSEKVAENKTELRFLPEVLAEAIDLGVMQALYEMQKHHTDCVEIFNCNRLIKHELGRKEKSALQKMLQHLLLWRAPALPFSALRHLLVLVGGRTRWKSSDYRYGGGKAYVITSASN